MEADRSEVLLLGAGFSRAVSEAMPITDELGRRAIQEAGLEGDPRVPARIFDRTFTFEGWLSLLAEEQPYLDESDNADNTSLFVRLRDAIVRVLAAKEDEVVAGKAPDWLYALISLLHYRKLTVVTLNYDTLIETTVRSHHLSAEGTGNRVAPEDIVWDIPPTRPTGGGVYVIARSFRLLKLHGSLDWWGTLNDTSGATLLRSDSTSTWGNPIPLDEETRQRNFPGRSSLIIPPTATKFTYYRNPIVRELWQTAYRALRDADRLAVIGCSLAPMDVVVSGMIESAIRGRQVAVDVVNRDPDGLDGVDGPRQRLLGLGAAEDRLTSVDGDDCVKRYVKSLCDRASAELVAELAARPPESGVNVALQVSWASPMAGGPYVRGVEEIRRLTGETVELRTTRGIPLGTTTMRSPDSQGRPIERTFPTLADLMHETRTARRIVATAEDGRTSVIIGSWHEQSGTGVPKWITLAPAGEPPLP